MSLTRFSSLDTVRNRPIINAEKIGSKISDFFASNVFTKSTMQDHLSKGSFKQLQDCIETGKKIDSDLADDVAAAMRSWSMQKGATHFTHWFQPLTGSTAEKHDSFFGLSADGKAMEHFGGKELVQQEPDASSFPNGGIRNTFEARGYTAWDPTSPAFIFEGPAGKTLCIPTIFVSYTGESLDFKTPLIKSLHAIEQAAVAVCNYFHRDVTKVFPTLGVEQEYFLVDRALYFARPDLVACGRTVFGHSPARGQQLEDHYFGSIPERVHAYMKDFENEAHKLGIPLLTRHNEVAPAQYECAPLFSEINLAVDHNQLLMDVMDKVARKHNFAVLFHEKPFAGVNGSGKHNNWSLSTNTGINLLSPGKTPKSNLLFLSFFVNTIKAFHDNADLIRASIASAANDHRLGANEAPPAIMSVFIGSTLFKVLEDIENEKFDDKGKLPQDFMKHEVKNIPEILKDNTDRNRTSPFAFTGNKFELRAVGSSANSALPMTIINAAVAAQLQEFKKDVDKLIADGKTRDAAILKVLNKYIKASKKILFEGNGYSEEWVKEAEQRGLANVKTTPEALSALVSKKAIKLFESQDVYSESEIHARHEIMLEAYARKIQIESRTMVEIAQTQIVPAALQYQNALISSVKGLKDVGVKTETYAAQLGHLEEVSKHLNKVIELSNKMVEARKVANSALDAENMATEYCHKVKGEYFDNLRYHVDKLENLVDDNIWPLPKYRELLFMR